MVRLIFDAMSYFPGFGMHAPDRSHIKFVGHVPCAPFVTGVFDAILVAHPAQLSVAVIPGGAAGPEHTGVLGLSATQIASLVQATEGVHAPEGWHVSPAGQAVAPGTFP